MTSDIIVGFPGETEQDLEDTVTLLEDVEYDAVFRVQVLSASEYAGGHDGRFISLTMRSRAAAGAAGAAAGDAAEELCAASRPGAWK